MLPVQHVTSTHMNVTCTACAGPAPCLPLEGLSLSHPSSHAPAGTICLRDAHEAIAAVAEDLATGQNSGQTGCGWLLWRGFMLNGSTIEGPVTAPLAVEA